MKLKITLSQTDILPPVRGEHSLSKYKLDDQTYSVVFNLTKDCSTTKKFIRIMDTMLKEDIINCAYNFYPTVQVDTFIKMKQKMNWIIKELTARDDVPNPEEWTVLNEKSLETEVLKLNALHLYFEEVTKSVFEQDSLRTSPGYGEDSLLYVHLEEINQLVHSMEAWEPPVDLSFFGTTRIMTQHGAMEKQNLTDEDYNNFRTDFKWGDLTLDYFRVGKDLQTCFATNDIELVKTKGLEQQITVHPSFEMRFIEETPDWTTDIESWIKYNNLDQYYDFSLPEFTSGRVVLGKIDMTGTTKEEVMKEIIKCTNLTNVELIDE